MSLSSRAKRSGGKEKGTGVTNAHLSHLPAAYVSEAKPVAPEMDFRAAELSVSALEFAHEAGQGLQRLGCNRVVERDAHAAHRAVARCADQTCGFGFFRKFLFFGFVAAGYPEDYVHL